MDQDNAGGVLYPDEFRRPGYAALRRFRESKPSANYFLTMNLAGRGSGLEKPALTAAVIAHWSRLETEGYWNIRTATVMPDHLHLLVRLGEFNALEAGVKLMKGRLSPLLRSAGLRWQDGFYDHALRQNEDALPVFLYIYLNPYRAGLLRETEIWPGYRCRPEDWEWFGPMTKESAPQHEWLR